MSTDFTKIEFEANRHRYFLNGVELTGVTNKIKEFQKPFDRDGIAAKVAEKEGKTVANVLASWEWKAEQGRRLGTSVHEHIEGVLKGEENGGGKQLVFDTFLSMNTCVPEIAQFDLFWNKLAPQVSYSQDHIEWIIGDQEMGVAGTVDMMFYSPETGQHHLWDWKTGKFELGNKFDTLLFPFNDLEASNLNIYSLQLSLYRLIIERNTDFHLGDSYLVHLTPTGYQVHRAVDLRHKLLNCLLAQRVL